MSPSLRITFYFLFLVIFYSCKPEGYKVVKIANQTWMAKNLDVVTYRNGDSIPFVQDSAQWSRLTTGAWCYYENITEYGKKYGRLYNCYAVTDSRGLAPEGWRVPSDSDWSSLVETLGGKLVAGGKLKTTIHWKVPNVGATSYSKFSALPAGGRRGSGIFAGFGTYSAFWTTDPDQENFDNAWGWALVSNQESIGHISFYKGAAFSVRCIKE